MQYAGVDIGGTKCAVVLGNAQGEILEKVKFATTEYTDTMENIRKALRKLPYHWG